MCGTDDDDDDGTQVNDEMDIDTASVSSELTTMHETDDDSRPSSSLSFDSQEVRICSTFFIAFYANYDYYKCITNIGS